MTQEEIDALPDSYELVLRKPITLGAETWERLIFHEPTTKQLKDASRMSDMDATTWLLANSAGVAPPVIDLMSARDLKKASKFIEGFTQDAQPTRPAD